MAKELSVAYISGLYNRRGIIGAYYCDLDSGRSQDETEKPPGIFVDLLRDLRETWLSPL